MLLRGKSKERSSSRKVTPPGPSHMDSQQFAAFLTNLRENRVNRPGGARPRPESSSTSGQPEPDRTTASRPSIGGASLRSETSIATHQRTYSDAPKPLSRPSYAGSVASRYSTMSGRDYYPDRPSPVKPLRPDEVVPTATYMERGTRWMEKEEAVSLRAALEDMDIRDNEDNKDQTPEDDETRLYNAALDEASELVYQHQNGVKTPEPGAPYRYKPHMRKNSYAHARTASVGKYGDEIVATGLARDGARSVSGSSSGSEGRRSMDSARPSMDGVRTTSMDSSTSKPYGSLNSRKPSGGRRRTSLKRNISGEVQRPFSGDQIWEESEGDTPKPKLAARPSDPATLPPRLKLRNPLDKVQSLSESISSELNNKSSAGEVPVTTKPLSRTEIHRNPPSQSRNPDYMTNTQKPLGPRANDNLPKKNGVEIRGDDIRSATSFKLGERSPRLPTPSAVSDSPGRPIVSFDARWTPAEEAAADKIPEPTAAEQRQERQQSSRFSSEDRPDFRKQGPASGQSDSQQPIPQVSTSSTIPTISVTPSVQAPAASSTRPAMSGPPPIPSISIDTPNEDRKASPSIPMLAITSEDGPTVPTIILPGDDDAPAAPGIPIIVTPDDDGYNKASSPSKGSARPLPTPARPNPFQRNARGTSGSRSHWSPAPGSVSSRATAVCHECSFPIEGRFVSLRDVSARFHPQCFACYTCGTSLEALEISPEPESFRSERLERIARRRAGEVLPEEAGKTTAEDGDERLRFFCHLDWHELYAPRCKTCTTPILGDHVVALGHHFHYGHFFCAECGDPFHQGDTHIEKDGYAWCVRCQTRRTERRAPKCRRCRLPVIGQYVQALGGEWHDACFRCGACGGGFDDGQIFPLEDGRGIRCTGCRMRELKA